MNRLSIIFFISIISLTMHGSIMATRQYVDQSMNQRIQELQEDYFPKTIYTIITNQVDGITNSEYTIGIPDNVASNLIFDNSSLKPTNLMLSNNPYIDNFIASNSSSFNICLFRNSTNRFEIVPGYSLTTITYYPSITNIVNIPIMLRSDEKINPSNYITEDDTTNYNYALTGLNNTIKIGNNIFDSIHYQTNTFSHSKYIFAKLPFMTNSNIIIGNNIAPFIISPYTFRFIREKSDVEDTIILAPKVSDNIYKRFGGFKSSVVINVGSNKTDSAGFNINVGNIGDHYNYRTVNKICITADNGIDDILINQYERSDIISEYKYTSLSNIIENMIINRVNQMRPQ